MPNNRLAHRRPVTSALRIAAPALLLLQLLGSMTARGETPNFQRDVAPILQQHCLRCHNPSKASGGLDLSTTKSALAGGESGQVIVPGRPDDSLLIAYVTGEKPEMPKESPPLAKAAVDALRHWIAEGAAWPEGLVLTERRAIDGNWWSLVPPAKVDVPRLDSPWIRTPVDAFILAELKAHDLAPAPEADRRTLIRRLTYDLHGLPPGPQEIDAYLADTRDDAYEQLVDRLLASPRYGERWGRHWLDVVHFGESHGYDKDKPRPNAWPYRDYVIRSFNLDIPYDVFAVQQVAGDVLFPADPWATVATGFIAAGPWDFVGHVELREGTVDKDIARSNDRDDMVANTMSTFTSLTVHCARCHDHKFDPISQADYYALQAVFAGVDRADRPYELDPRLAQLRSQLAAERSQCTARLSALRQQMAKIEAPEIAAVDYRLKELAAELTSLPQSEDAAPRRKEIERQTASAREARQKLIEARASQSLRADLAAAERQLQSVDDRIAKLPKPTMVYAGANRFDPQGTFSAAATPRPIYLLARGDVRNRGPLVEPSAPRCVQGPDPQLHVDDSNIEGQRRAALARWLADPRNALVRRSIVNRVWQYHFGAGIVDTPNDFGRMGSAPSHPALLEWLAQWFAAGGHSLKKLHKLLLTSAVYRQSSKSDAHGTQIDSSNRLLWRMNRQRLDAECIHDAILAVSGKLDLTMGGPSVQQFFFKDDHSPVYDYARYDVDDPRGWRRSVYRFLVRSVPDPFMECLDCADPSIMTPKRNATLTSIQALALLNNPFVVRQAELFAERLRAISSEASGQIEAAYRLALARNPTDEERRALADYVARHGLENLCRLIFNSNEFVFID